MLYHLAYEHQLSWTALICRDQMSKRDTKQKEEYPANAFICILLDGQTTFYVCCMQILLYITNQSCIIKASLI